MDKSKELQDFAIWMTGCGYDFTQHEHFLKNRYLLTEDLKDKKEMTFKEWREENVFYYLNEHSFQNINGASVENAEVIKMYVKYKSL
jgi:hypothetical protein